VANAKPIGAANAIMVLSKDNTLPCNWLGIIVCNKAVKGAFSNINVVPFTSHQIAASQNRVGDVNATKERDKQVNAEPINIHAIFRFG